MESKFEYLDPNRIMLGLYDWQKQHMENVVEDDRLLESIEEIGQLDAIIVFFSADRFVVSDGLRRVQACSRLGKDVLVEATECTDSELNKKSDIVMKSYITGLR